MISSPSKDIMLVRYTRLWLPQDKDKDKFYPEYRQKTKFYIISSHDTSWKTNFLSLSHGDDGLEYEEGLSKSLITQDIFHALSEIT